MTPVNEASVLGLTVYFPGSRYTLKLPDLSVLNVVDSPFEFRAVNVPFRMGFSSAPKMRPDTMSADAGKENHIAPAKASAIIANVIRLGLGKRCVCNIIRSYPGSFCSSSHPLLVRILHPLFYARPAPLCSVVDQFDNYERGLTVAAVCGAVKQMNGTHNLSNVECLLCDVQ